MSEEIPRRKSGKRPKKHKFRGNQFTVPKCSQRLSASSKKLSNSFILPDSNDLNFNGYSIIDKAIVFNLIQNCVVCKICGGNITIISEVVGGLSEKIKVVCVNCNELSSTRNSAMLGRKKNLPEINSRFIYAMRTLGLGLSGAKTFCGVMDLPPPISLKAYNSVVKSIKDASSSAAKKSMCSAVEEEIALNENNRDLIVSGDGTWKTRGHSSLVGVCTVIGALSGKVIDTEVLSSFCKGCSSWKGQRSGDEYQKWFSEHSKECQKNHSGSAGMMEVVGMQRIFLRSSATYDVRYLQYIGDGDTKTFSALQQSQPYGSSAVLNKIECIGHMQKRLGSRLRKRKQDMKGKKLSDKKSLSGKGRLTDDLINKLTIYYGNAIRKHHNSVSDMQKAIWAIYFHYRSTDLEPSHDFCPIGLDSWCTYQRAVSENKTGSYKHKCTVSPVVMDAIKDIFKDLSMPSLLKRCLGGHTQNANESINALIWKLCPKNSGSGSKIVQIAVNEAVILYNNGQVGRINTMKELGYQIGHNVTSFASNTDQLRIKSAEKKAMLSTLEARRATKRAKLALQEAAEEEEGTVYASGQF